MSSVHFKTVMVELVHVSQVCSGHYPKSWSFGRLYQKLAYSGTVLCVLTRGAANEASAFTVMYATKEEANRCQNTRRLGVDALKTAYAGVSSTVFEDLVRVHGAPMPDGKEYRPPVQLTFHRRDARFETSSLLDVSKYLEQRLRIESGHMPYAIVSHKHDAILAFASLRDACVVYHCFIRDFGPRAAHFTGYSLLDRAEAHAYHAASEAAASAPLPPHSSARAEVKQEPIIPEVMPPVLLFIGNKEGDTEAEHRAKMEKVMATATPTFTEMLRGGYPVEPTGPVHCALVFRDRVTALQMAVQCSEAGLDTQIVATGDTHVPVAAPVPTPAPSSPSRTPSRTRLSQEREAALPYPTRPVVADAADPFATVQALFEARMRTCDLYQRLGKWIVQYLEGHPDHMPRDPLPPIPIAEVGIGEGELINETALNNRLRRKGWAVGVVDTVQAKTLTLFAVRGTQSD